jgi:inorganic pyrophosphatase
VDAMSELPSNIMNDLEQFFVDYNKLEGKKFKILEKMGPKEAQRLVQPKG